MFPTPISLAASWRKAGSSMGPGLFEGKRIQSGFNVPKSKHRTRRTWMPNVQSKTLFSPSLNKSIKLSVTTSALRTIDKHGGLDNYLFRTKPEKLGETGMTLRELVKEARRKMKGQQLGKVEGELVQEVR